MIGQEIHADQPVYHVLLFHNLSGQAPEVTAFVQQFSAIDFYLDASSLLPTAIAFSIHGDENSGVSIPLEIRFGNYRTVSGVLVPFHIQKLVQGTLTLDLAVTQATVNTGVSASTFTIPELPTGGAQ